MWNMKVKIIKKIELSTNYIQKNEDKHFSFLSEIPAV